MDELFLLVIVDDEYWALKGIENSCDWGSAGFEIALSTTDPAEARERIMAGGIDCALIDVRMDDVNGLDMIEEFRRRGLGTEFIVISGYDQFEYAKRGIALGIFDYILKPIDKAEVLAAAKRLGSRLWEKRARSAGNGHACHLATEAAEETAAAPDNAAKVRDMLIFMEERHAENLYLKDLALRFYFTETYICDLFRKHLGKTFSDLLRDIRMENAKRLLGEGGLPLSEVARRVGYSNTDYFARVFKKTHGITPLQYRRAARSHGMGA